MNENLIHDILFMPHGDLTEIGEEGSSALCRRCI